MQLHTVEAVGISQFLVLATKFHVQFVEFYTSSPIPVYAILYPVIVSTSRMPHSLKCGIVLINFIIQVMIMLAHTWCFSLLCAKLLLYNCVFVPILFYNGSQKVRHPVIFLIWLGITSFFSTSGQNTRSQGQV